MAKIKRGTDFRSFAIFLADGTSYIFDAETGRLVSAQVDDTVQIVADGGATYYSVNNTTYRINVAGEISEADKYVSFDTEIAQQFIVNEITPEKVVVIRDDGKVW